MVSDSVTPWTVTHQAPLFMEFPRQEYWRGLPFPSPRDLPDPGIAPNPGIELNPGIKPGFPTLQADSLPSEPPAKSPPGKQLSLAPVYSGGNGEIEWIREDEDSHSSNPSIANRFEFLVDESPVATLPFRPFSLLILHHLTPSSTLQVRD